MNFCNLTRIFFLFFFTTLFSQNTTNRINPFLNQEVDLIARISDFKFITVRQVPDHGSVWGGFISHPQRLRVRFSLLFKDGKPIRDIAAGRFSFRLRSVKTVGIEVPVTHETRWSSKHYQSKLYFPPLDRAGDYELVLSIRKPNGRIQEFVSGQVVSYSERKVNLLFLIDNSGSMSENDPGGQRYKSIEKMVNSSHFRGKIDQVGVVGFAEEATILSPIMSARKWNSGKLKKGTISSGRTDFNQAFDSLSEFYRKNINLLSGSKTMVIFLTDGESSFHYQGQHREMKKFGVPVFTVGLTKGKNKSYNKAILKKIAADTGGEFFETQDEATRVVYQKMIESSIRRREQIVIYPAKPSYHANELVVIRYAELVNIGSTQVQLALNNSVKQKGESELGMEKSEGPEEILYHRKFQSGGEVGIIHFRQPQPNSQKDYQFVLEFVRGRSKNLKNGRLSGKPVRSYLQRYRVDDQNSDISTEPLVFRNIPLVKNEIRYFNLKSSVEQIDYVDLTYFPSNPTGMQSLKNKKSETSIFFPETPFTIIQSQPYQQSVFFKILPPQGRILSGSIEGYLMIESARGNFVHNFTYTLDATDQNIIETRLRIRSTGLDERERWLYLLSILTGLFLLLLLYYLRSSRKSNRKK